MADGSDGGEGGGGGDGSPIRRFILRDDRIAVPCPDLFDWAMWIENDDHRRVGWTCIGSVVVSTVFLGIDHAFGGVFGHRGRLLFETMVRDSDLVTHEEYDWDDQERCATWLEAERQHARAVKAVHVATYPERYGLIRSPRTALADVGP